MSTENVARVKMADIKTELVVTFCSGRGYMSSMGGEGDCY